MGRRRHRLDRLLPARRRLTRRARRCTQVQAGHCLPDPPGTAQPAHPAPASRTRARRPSRHRARSLTADPRPGNREPGREKGRRPARRPQRRPPPATPGHPPRGNRPRTHRTPKGPPWKRSSSPGRHAPSPPPSPRPPASPPAWPAWKARRAIDRAWRDGPVWTALTAIAPAVALPPLTLARVLRDRRTRPGPLSAFRQPPAPEG